MTILKESNNYTIEYRIFKDSNWFKGWFRNIAPQWSEWTIWKDNYNTLKDLQEDFDKLEAKRPYLKYRSEYRMIKKN